MIDHDFLNDTLENLLQSDIYRHVDFLTGVTLNEGLYFAEYHIGHFYSGNHHQSASIGGRRPPTSSREKRSLSTNISTIIAPDIIFDPIIESLNIDDDDDDEGDDDDEDDRIDESKVEQRTHVEQALTYDPQIVLEQFSKLDYIKRYLNANFQHGKCYLKEVKKRYEIEGLTNEIEEKR